MFDFIVLRAINARQSLTTDVNAKTYYPGEIVVIAEIKKSPNGMVVGKTENDLWVPISKPNYIWLKQANVIELTELKHPWKTIESLGFTAWETKFIVEKIKDKSISSWYFLGRGLIANSDYLSTSYGSNLKKILTSKRLSINGQEIKFIDTKVLKFRVLHNSAIEISDATPQFVNGNYYFKKTNGFQVCWKKYESDIYIAKKIVSEIAYWVIYGEFEPGKITVFFISKFNVPGNFPPQNRWNIRATKKIIVMQQIFEFADSASFYLGPNSAPILTIEKPEQKDVDKLLAESYQRFKLSDDVRSGKARRVDLGQTSACKFTNGFHEQFNAPQMKNINMVRGDRKSVV